MHRLKSFSQTLALFITVTLSMCFLRGSFFYCEQTSCTAVLCASLFTSKTSRCSQGQDIVSGFHFMYLFIMKMSRIVPDTFNACFSRIVISEQLFRGHSFILRFIVRCGTASAHKLDMSRQAAESYRTREAKQRLLSCFNIVLNESLDTCLFFPWV